MHFFPYRYIDRSRFYPINALPQNTSEVQIKGIISEIKLVKQQRGKRMVATFKDDTGTMELVWFRGHQWIRQHLKLNTPYVVFGRLNWFKGRPSISHPEMELESEHQKEFKYALHSIYSSSENLTSKGITQECFIKSYKSYGNLMERPYTKRSPPFLMTPLNLLSKKEALFQVHFPKNQSFLPKRKCD